MKLRHFFCICFIFLLRPVTYSQDSVRCGSWISANVHYGFIIPLYQSGMVYLIHGHVPGLELDYIEKSPDETPWNQAYHHPEIGVSFFYGWLGNPAELGNMIGLFPFVNLHLQRSNKEKFYLRIGIGLGYLPVNYDRFTNHKDILIGSHINGLINLRLIHHYYLSDNIRIETGFGITHTSDGSFKTPNLGINIVTVNTGVSYCLNPTKYVAHPYTDTVKRPKYEHELFFAAGLSQIEPPGGVKYFATTLGYTIYHPINSKNKIGGGIDIFNNKANMASLKIDDSISITSLQNTQIGLKASYEITIGKIGLPIELGGYIYSKYTGRGYEYNRIGVRYYTPNHLIINLTLLTHFASADYIEWGIGYKL